MALSSAEAELVPLDSGALNRNWQPNYSFTFDAGHFPTDVTWTYRDASKYPFLDAHFNTYDLPTLYVSGVICEGCCECYMRVVLYVSGCHM